MSVYYNQPSEQKENQQGTSDNPQFEKEKEKTIFVRRRPSASAHPSRVMKNIKSQVIVTLMLFGTLLLVKNSKNLTMYAVIALIAFLFYFVRHSKKR